MFSQIVYYASILAGKLESPKLREEDNDSDFMTEDDSLLIYSGSKKSPSADFTDALAEELQVNVLDCRKPYIPFEEFYNEPLSDAIEMDNDYLYYKNRQGGMFYRSEMFTHPNSKHSINFNVHFQLQIKDFRLCYTHLF